MPYCVIGGVHLQAGGGQVQCSLGSFVASEQGAEIIVRLDEFGCVGYGAYGRFFAFVLGDGCDVGEDGGEVDHGQCDVRAVILCLSRFFYVPLVFYVTPPSKRSSRALKRLYRRAIVQDNVTHCPHTVENFMSPGSMNSLCTATALPSSCPRAALELPSSCPRAALVLLYPPTSLLHLGSALLSSAPALKESTRTMTASAATTTQQAYEEAMDDVHTRFILNLPSYELASPTRIFFQLEQAWWFYDDFICDAPASPSHDLPRFKHMKPFSLAMFQFSPLLQPLVPKFDEMYAEFNEYKRSISTYGTILLNDDATKVALCRNWNGKSWTLPGGKVNQNESGRDAAARETYEETGFDPYGERGICGEWRERRERGEMVQELIAPEKKNCGDNDDLGLVPFFEGDAPKSNVASSTSLLLPWETLQDDNKLIYTEADTNKRRTCYVCRGVPENFPFQPIARKEVSEVKFHELANLPKNTYAVLPFLGELKKWIRRDNKRRNAGSNDDNRPNTRSGSRSKNETRRATPNPKDRGGSTPKQRPSSNKKDKQRSDSRPNSKQKPRSNSKEVQHDDPLVASALASPGEPNRWTEEEMFATNERLMGRKITYSGNPHEFAEKGFAIESGQRLDPHSFRVVGGHFMNSEKKILAAPPRVEALQPLVARERSAGRNRSESLEYPDDEVELTPFFSDGGKAPWEEEGVARLSGLMEGFGISQKAGEEKEPVRSMGSNSKGLALLSRLRQGDSANESVSAADETFDSDAAMEPQQHAYDWFLTDKEITAKSQKEKLCSMLDSASPMLEPALNPPSTHSNGMQNEHWQWMKNWVNSLPRAPATEHFGEFHFDVDSIMTAVGKHTLVR
ncbi:hypothetical protein HJC23_012369 [Cyclotella cryptica]|uniref:Nudix hydrolase domain-containing protein n=1 Tax=Cyclotella cryptica TaxID=29204 RepID=A0ABD3QCM3_9STRA|eukprot:CCRYP_006571-RA/>CCRYP_006571-RA protein AED:0.20 eAED:0.03 QI:0/-1/0/1/-1/1/1/0/852